MKIKDILSIIEEVAPMRLQESYDNSGLLVGDGQAEVDKLLLCIDITEAVVQEAIDRGCGLVLSHHPIIFNGLKRLTPETYVERTVLLAIRNNIALAAMHTNLDNSNLGVNKQIADKLGIVGPQILEQKEGVLRKLIAFVPESHADAVREVMFEAGGGHIGNYSSCSYNTNGMGSFKANNEANPHVGAVDQLHFEPEQRIEMVVPNYLVQKVVKAMKAAHPYEEVAYDVISLQNNWSNVGAGMIGLLPHRMDEIEFLDHLRQVFNVPVLRHSPLLHRKIEKVALCGGSGAFLLPQAKRAGADAFITADIKYHQFFDPDGALLMVDAGHFETEQFTKELMADILRKKNANFAVLFSDVNTNAVRYYFK